MGLGPLKQEAGGERSWSIVFLWVSSSAEKKKKTPQLSVGLGKGRQPPIPGVCVMSQVPGTCGYTIVRFICGCLQDSWESFRGRDQREQSGATGKGAMPP